MVSTRNPRYSLSTEIKNHKFCGFKTDLCNHHSYKPGHIPTLAEGVDKATCTTIIMG